MIYTVGFLCQTGDMTVDFENNEKWKLLLVRKNYPEGHKLSWMNGKLNAFGGKLEDHKNESLDGCIEREFYEETGLRIKNWELFCITENLQNNDEVYYYKAYVHKIPELVQNKTDVGESIELIDFDSIFNRNDILDDLKWLIPLGFIEKRKILAEIIFK